MSKPKKWDAMTESEQEAWNQKKRVYERDLKRKIRELNPEKARALANSAARKHRSANREKISAKRRKKYNANPKVIEKRLMKKEIQGDLEKIERRRKLNAQNQRNRYARNREKVLAQKNEWRIKNKEKVMASANESVYREHLAEMKASGKKVEPAKLDMSKVLAFISKKDGPKSQKPITPNMAKVREFIKYA